MNDELYHWGILKQKWGERRYQNPDGSYTEEGKARKRAAYEAAKGTITPVKDYFGRNKKAKKMTDDELRARINRIKLENEYNTLTKKNHPVIDAGAKIVKDAVFKFAQTKVNQLVDSLTSGKEPEAKKPEAKDYTLKELEANDDIDLSSYDDASIRKMAKLVENRKDVEKYLENLKDKKKWSTDW